MTAASATPAASQATPATKAAKAARAARATTQRRAGSSAKSGAPAAGQRLAVISARWHADIVGQARQALLAELAGHGWAAGQVDQFELPGAFEIPLLAKKLALSGRYQAVLACALVVDGGLYRHEFVAGAVIDGLMRVQLDTGVPVFSAVLTPHHFHEHEEHRQFFARHFIKKGQEVAQACLQTLACHQQVQHDLALS